MICLNPFARVETIRGPAGGIQTLRIVAPVKGRGLQATKIAHDEDPAAFDRAKRAVLTALFDAQAGRDPWNAAADWERELLERSGLFVSDAERPRPVVFDAPIPSSVDVGKVSAIGATGFTVARGVVQGDLLASLRGYYDRLIAEGFATYGGEGGEPHRWVVHNEAVARRLYGLVSLVAVSAAGEPLKPSFTYLLKYLEGATLEPHRDREQCAVTAVLQVDFDPEPGGVSPWPLFFKTSSALDAVFLALGDLVVFRGTQIDHYREALACGRSSTNLAFCFVPKDYDGPLD